MGIGNDIRPKRKFNYAHQNQHTSFGYEKAPETPTQKDEEAIDVPLITEEVPSFKDIENLEDSFFKEEKKNDKSPIEHKLIHQEVKHKKFPGRQIIAILFTILFGLVIYQNFDSIKDLWQSKEPTKTTIDNSDVEDVYLGETPAESATTPEETTTPTTPTTTTTPETSTTTPTTTPATTPTTTTRAFTIEVLNGNGIAGSATTVKNILVKAGLKVSATATASKSNYTNTNIYYKTGYEAEATKVKNALSSRTCVLQKSDTIAKNYNVVVVVGKN